MHRRVRVAGLLSLVLCSTIVASVGCGGEPLICDPDTNVCEFATPEPTSDPPNPPAPGTAIPQPLLPYCVAPSDVELLYPSASGTLSSYQNVVYVALRAGVQPAYPLAVHVVAFDAGGTRADEIGSVLTDVTGSRPAYVPAPDAGFGEVYASGNLPIPAGTTVQLTLLSVGSGQRCTPVALGTFVTTQTYRRVLR